MKGIFNHKKDYSINHTYINLIKLKNQYSSYKRNTGKIICQN